MSEETTRFHIPFPSRGIPNWFEQFQSFAANIDSLLFSMMEMSSLIWTGPFAIGSMVAGAAPNTWELSIVSGALEFISRTFGSKITLTTPNGGVDPLVLRNRGVIVASIPRGPTEDLTVEMEVMDGSVSIDASYQVLGVFYLDSGVANVAWWNGSITVVDVMSVIGMSWPMIVHGELYLFENVVATTISAVDEWSEVGNLTTGETEVMDVTGNALEVQIGGRYEVEYNASAIAALADKDCEFAVGLNFSAPSTGIQDKSVHPRRLDNVIPRGASGGAILVLVAGDLVSFLVRNTTDGEDVTVGYLNFRAKRIG